MTGPEGERWPDPPWWFWVVLFVAGLVVFVVMGFIMKDFRK